MSLTSELSEHTRPLDRRKTASDGLFRIAYGLRIPDRGRGLGLDGVDGEELIDHYAEAIERAAGIFLGWGWPEPKRDANGRVPVFVFRTERLGFGDCPLTFTGEVEPDVYASQIALRSTFDEPRREVRLERARIEAAHETAHAFTHRHVSPLTEVGDLWAWFDEATAVFIEGYAYPDHPEALRFGLYWVCCPEFTLLSWGGFGGYFAAWFVKYLVKEFDARILLEVWSGSEGKFGPLEVLARKLEDRGKTFADVFWSYCCEGSASDGIDANLLASFGLRGDRDAGRAPGSRRRGDGRSAVQPVLSHRLGRGRSRGAVDGPRDHPGDGPARLGGVVRGDRTQGSRSPAGGNGPPHGGPGRRRAIAVEGEPSGAGRIPGAGGRPRAAASRPAAGPGRSGRVRVAVGDRPAWNYPRPGETEAEAEAEAAPALEGFVDATDYTFEAEDGSRLTVLVTPREDRPSGSRDEIARKLQEYRDRLTAFLDAPITFEVVDPSVRPGVRARGLSFDFQSDDRTWRERSAFLELADGPALQISVVAPAELREAADWFEKAVGYLRPSAAKDEIAVAARSTAPSRRSRPDGRTGRTRPRRAMCSARSGRPRCRSLWGSTGPAPSHSSPGTGRSG